MHRQGLREKHIGRSSWEVAVTAEQGERQTSTRGSAWGKLIPTVTGLESERGRISGVLATSRA